MYFPFKLTQLVPCSVFSFFRDVIEGFWKSTYLFLPCNSAQSLHLVNDHITITLLQARAFSFAKFSFEFSDAVLVPTVNDCVCESYCVWECPHGDTDEKSVREHRQWVCPNWVQYWAFILLLDFWFELIPEILEYCRFALGVDKTKIMQLSQLGKMGLFLQYSMARCWPFFILRTFTILTSVCALTILTSMWKYPSFPSLRKIKL